MSIAFGHLFVPILLPRAIKAYLRRWMVTEQVSSGKWTGAQVLVQFNLLDERIGLRYALLVCELPFQSNPQCSETKIVHC